MKRAAIIGFAVLVLIVATDAGAGTAQYIDAFDGLTFSYNDKEWRLRESAVSGKVILVRAPGRGSGRIIIARRAEPQRHAGEKQTTIDIERGGRRYVVSCTAQQEDYMFVFFSCNELARSIQIKQHASANTINAVDSLGVLPSHRTSTQSPLHAAVYALFADAQGCTETSAKIRMAARATSSPLSVRLNVIADLIRGWSKRARTGAVRLVGQYGTPLDFVLLGLAAKGRVDAQRWRSAYARGRVRGSLIDYWQGIVALKEQRIEAAAMFFERVFKESPSDLAAAKLAEIALSVGDVESARRWWKVMDDDSILKAALTVELAYKDGAYEDALWIFDHYDGAWCGMLGACAATNAARAANARGQRKHARQLLKRALAFDKSFAPAYKLLAQMAVEDGQGNEEVVKVLKRYLPHASMQERQHLLSVIDGL